MEARAHGLDSRRACLQLALCLIFAMTGGVGQWASVALMPNVESEIGLDRAAASSLYALTLAGFAIGSLFYGWLADRVGPRPLMLASALAIGAGFVVIAVSRSYLGLAFAHFVLIGLLGSSTSFALVISEVSFWFRRWRGVAVSIVASGLYFAGAIWSPLLQGLIGPLGWQGTNLLIAAVCLTVMPAAVWAMGRARPAAAPAEEAAASARLGSAGISPRGFQILLCAAGVCCCVAMAMPQVHIIGYCISLGLGPAVGAEMLSAMLAAGIVSRIGFGLVADWIGGVWTLLIGSSLQMLMILAFLAAEGTASLYAVAVLFGLSQGGIVPSYALIVRQYFPASQAHWRVSLVTMATVAGMAFGGWLPGLIFEASGDYRLAFLNGAAWNVANLAIVVWIIGRVLPARGAPARA